MKFKAKGEFREFLLNQETGFEVDQAASSHWKSYDKFLDLKVTSFNETEIEFKLKGFGFGSYHKKGILGVIKNIPTIIFLKCLLRSSSNTEHADKAISKELGVLRSYDSYRMCRTIDYLNKFINMKNIQTVCIIGDGFGRLGILLKYLYPQLKITHINLAKTLIYDISCTLKIFTNVAYQINDVKVLSPDFTFFDAKHKTKAPNCDLYINIASMQEMNYDEINEYFDLIGSSQGAYFYCCNRIEKTLPDGKIIEFDNYPWSKKFSIIDEEKCAWHQWQPVNKPPFFKRFDGPIKHKLTKVQQL